MDMKTFSRGEKAARLSEKLLAIEEKRNQGQRGYSPEEVYDILDQVINGGDKRKRGEPVDGCSRNGERKKWP